MNVFKKIFNGKGEAALISILTAALFVAPSFAQALRSTSIHYNSDDTCIVYFDDGTHSSGTTIYTDPYGGTFGCQVGKTIWDIHSTGVTGINYLTIVVATPANSIGLTPSTVSKLTTYISSLPPSSLAPSGE